MNAIILKLGSIGVQQHRKVGQRRDPLLADAGGVSLSVRVGRAHYRYRAVNVSVSFLNGAGGELAYEIGHAEPCGAGWGSLGAVTS
jgi:hypothetical protein